MALNRTVEPATEPLSTAEARAHLRVDVDVEDDGIAALIRTARAHVETYTGRALLAQTWKLTLDSFPITSAMELPKLPLIEVESVEYIDTDGELQTLEEFRVRSGSDVQLAQLLPPRGEWWPATDPDEVDAVRITIRAGYGALPGSVPEDIRHAMRLLIGHWFQNRQGVVTGTIAITVPLSVEALLHPYRVLEAV